MKIIFWVRHWHSNKSPAHHDYIFYSRYLLFRFYHNTRTDFTKIAYTYGISKTELRDTRDIPENKQFFSRMSKFKDSK